MSALQRSLTAAQRRTFTAPAVNDTIQQQQNSVRSKLDVQNSGTFQRLFKDPNCIFQTPKLSTKSHILDADIQNLDRNVTLVICIQVLASKLPTNTRFQNLQDVNSMTFQGFSSTFKHFICFQALSRALKFLFQIQAFSRISQACYEQMSRTSHYYYQAFTIFQLQLWPKS